MFISRVKRKIQSLISLELNFLHDYWRFKKYYTKGSQASKDKQKLESWILQDKHRIEKAFSLPIYIKEDTCIPSLFKEI